MKKKYLFKIYEKCLVCDGSGQYTATYCTSSTENIGYTQKEPCFRCDGLGKKEIKPSDKRFIKLYKKELEEKEKDYLKNYRILKNDADNYLKSYSMVVKELDKIINKK